MKMSMNENRLRGNTLSEKEVHEARLQNLQMDLEMLESSKERIIKKEDLLMLKLIHTRESLMTLEKNE